MARRPTENQAAVLAKMREIGRPVRPVEVVHGGHGNLPWTESTARGRLESMCGHGWVRRLDGTPALYALAGLFEEGRNGV